MYGFVDRPPMGRQQEAGNTPCTGWNSWTTICRHSDIPCIPNSSKKRKSTWRRWLLTGWRSKDVAAKWRASKRAIDNLNPKDLKVRGQKRQTKCRWKSEFAFFQSSSRLLQVTNFVKESYPSSEAERKFRCRLSTSSVKREIRHFHVAVVQWRQRNVQKSVMHVQNCCFAKETYCFFEVLVAVTVVGS